MSVTSSDGTEISIAYYVKEVNDDYGTNKNILEAIARNGTELAQTIINAMFETGVDLAETIRLSLLSREKLKPVDERVPESTTPIIVDRNRHVIYPELLGWAMAILSSAWTEWVFSSKSNEGSRYQNDPEHKNNESRQAATVNVKLTLPYIYNSIRDTLERAKEIGSCQETDYEPKPEIDPAAVSIHRPEQQSRHLMERSWRAATIRVPHLKGMLLRRSGTTSTLSILPVMLCGHI